MAQYKSYDRKKYSGLDGSSYSAEYAPLDHAYTDFLSGIRIQFSLKHKLSKQYHHAILVASLKT